MSSINRSSLSINNKNISQEIIFNGKACIAKRYENTSQYINEIKYLTLFKKRKFNVPEIEYHDKNQKIIVIQKISGYNNTTFGRSRILKCIDILARIESDFPLDKGYKIANGYINRVKSNLKLFCDAYNLTVGLPKIQLLINDLNADFKPSLFKDAKPANWIFNKKGVYLIDFEYIKPSFFLADLAQLLKYLDLQKRINFNYYLKYFLRKSSISDIKKYEDLFKLTIINSNMASIFHNKYLSQKIIKLILKQNFRLLKELNSVI